MREASGFGARLLQPYNRGIGRFSCRHVFAGALPQYFRRLCHVENIVDDLESETQPMAEACDSRKFFWISISTHRTKPHRALEDGCGLVLVNELQLVAFDVLAFSFEIGRLASDQFLAPCRNCNLARQD